MHHYRKTFTSYLRYNKADKKQPGCPFPFCQRGNKQKILEENETMFMIANRVPYDIFEGRRTLDHRMVIPKRHVEGAKDFTDQEKIDHMTLVGKYEAQGYNVYSRGAGSITRSVAHRHTHLIKLEEVSTKAIVYVKKPQFLLKL